MISKWEIKKGIEKLSKDNKITFRYNEQDDSIYDEAGVRICSLDEYVDNFRRHTGQSFETIYSCPATLLDLIRCTECGTVIFSSDSTYDYDDNLKCPVCTDYKPHFKYWTKEEIESDSEKKAVIDSYYEMRRLEIEQDKRIKRRNGKMDWEISKSTIKLGSRYKINFVLECNDITKSYFKGLRLLVRFLEKDNIGFVSKKHFTIPLSWSNFYIRFIYVHLGRCHPDVRSKWYIGKPIEERNK